MHVTTLSNTAINFETKLALESLTAVGNFCCPGSAQTACVPANAIPTLTVLEKGSKSVCNNWATLFQAFKFPSLIEHILEELGSTTSNPTLTPADAHIIAELEGHEARIAQYFEQVTTTMIWFRRLPDQADLEMPKPVETYNDEDDDDED